MNVDFVIQSLGRFPKILRPLVEGLSDETWRFKPPTKNWSILEIVCHLRDEEVEDFRCRVRSTLEAPDKPWPKIDPVGAAIERKYQEEDPETALAAFLQERETSLEWLRATGDADWNRSYQHPQFGAIPAGLLLGSWAAHDLLHLRQITKRLFEATEVATQPHPIDYAGSWQES